MQKALKTKLSKLINEIKEIEKKIILKKKFKPKSIKQKLMKWNNLSEKVSANWDNISVFEEIDSQRKK